MLCALNHPAAQVNDGTDRLERHCRDLLDVVPDLGQTLDALDEVAYERAFRSDKKHSPSAFRLVLPAAGEGVRQVETPSDADGWAVALQATRTVLASLQRTAA